MLGTGKKHNRFEFILIELKRLIFNKVCGITNSRRINYKPFIRLFVRMCNRYKIGV